MKSESQISIQATMKNAKMIEGEARMQSPQSASSKNLCKSVILTIKRRSEPFLAFE